MVSAPIITSLISGALLPERQRKLVAGEQDVLNRARYPADDHRQHEGPDRNFDDPEGALIIAGPIHLHEHRRHEPDDERHQAGADQVEQAVECARDARMRYADGTHDDVVRNVPALTERVRHLQENDGDDRKPQELVDAGDRLVE
jgi:hypothetical protein